MGLLTKITNTEPEAKPCFSTFCKKYGFVHAGVFAIVDGMYVLVNAFALDADTIIKSVSSPDFWKGTLSSSSAWHTYSLQQETLLGFYQFFGNAFKAHMNAAHYFSFTSNSQNYILGIFQLDTDFRTISLPAPGAAFISELEPFCSPRFCGLGNEALYKEQLAKATSHCPASLFTISFEKLVLTIIDKSTITTMNLRKQVEQTILSEISGLLSEAFQLENACIYTQGYEYHAVIFSKQLLNDSFIRLQITQTCASVIGSLNEELILVQFVEQTDSQAKIKSFLSLE